MQFYTKFSLGEIVNAQVLQEIQDKFSEATGLAAVIVDPDGKPITKPSNFTKFCTFVRSHPEGGLPAVWPAMTAAGARRWNCTGHLSIIATGG